MTDSNTFADHVMELFLRIHPLDRVPRAGFLLRGVPDPESVAAHSHFLALLALLYVDACPHEYDLGKTLSMALIHDLAEAQLMDIPMPVADRWLGKAKEAAEQGLFNRLFAAFPPSYAALHDEFLAAQSAEARLLRALDKAQMMLKVVAYERERRGRLEEFWEKPGNFNDYGIAAVSSLFDAICRYAGRERPMDTEPHLHQ
ncbi:MAG TPA: HD domain-containing protein [Candidatus Hydrogenedentes bacterium]|nr:HD domain-containing protein [Candidatus Hydrogenedentota bacterium]